VETHHGSPSVQGAPVGRTGFSDSEEVFELRRASVRRKRPTTPAAWWPWERPYPAAAEVNRTGMVCRPFLSSPLRRRPA
jgi:hypothetical protein